VSKLNPVRNGAVTAELLYWRIDNDAVHTIVWRSTELQYAATFNQLQLRSLLELCNVVNKFEKVVHVAKVDKADQHAVVAANVSWCRTIVTCLMNGLDNGRVTQLAGMWNVITVLSCSAVLGGRLIDRNCKFYWANSIWELSKRLCMWHSGQSLGMRLQLVVEQSDRLDKPAGEPGDWNWSLERKEPARVLIWCHAVWTRFLFVKSNTPRLKWLWYGCDCHVCNAACRELCWRDVEKLIVESTAMMTIKQNCCWAKLSLSRSIEFLPFVVNAARDLTLCIC
jgi:hypothetical protein